jgi:hypothetical protein
MSDDAPTRRDAARLDGKPSMGLVRWALDNWAEGDSDALRMCHAHGVLILHLRQQYRRAHLSQLVSTAYSVIATAERLRALEKGNPDVRH